MTPISVRPFGEDDVGELLELMKGLARFEGYIDDFVVTEGDLVEHGLGPSPRFEAFVAVAEEDSAPGGLLGMVVIYRIPWTYDLRPTLIMKELFVRDDARGMGVGQALMRRVGARARELDCPRLQWTVLSTNEPAKRFYDGFGAFTDPEWESWQLGEKELARL